MKYKIVTLSGRGLPSEVDAEGYDSRHAASVMASAEHDGDYAIVSMGSAPSERRQKKHSKYSPEARAFVEAKVRKLREEGYKEKTAVAIALSMARKKGLRVPAYPRSEAAASFDAFVEVLNEARREESSLIMSKIRKAHEEGFNDARHGRPSRARHHPYRAAYSEGYNEGRHGPGGRSRASRREQPIKPGHVKVDRRGSKGPLGRWELRADRLLYRIKRKGWSPERKAETLQLLKNILAAKRANLRARRGKT